MSMKFPGAIATKLPRFAVVVALLGSTLGIAVASSEATPALAMSCPAGTTAQTATWGASGGIVWDDNVQNTGLSRTYTGIGGSDIDMTMTITDPDNMNEDGDNPLVNLPTGDNNWDGPIYTQTDGAYGPGYLTLVMTSLNETQAVTLDLAFSAPVMLPDFSIGDIDYIGNNVVNQSAPHDSFQDEILLSANRNGTPVGFTGMTGTVGSPVVTLNNPAGGQYRVAGGPYNDSTNGNLNPGDAAGTVTLSTNAPVTGLQIQYSNGPDDAAADATHLAAAGGTWPAANFAAPMTGTEVGVSNNHAVRLNVFTVCTGALELGDTVWADIDADGIQDPNEPGIAGVTVTLYGQDGLALGTTTTDSNGEYVFTDLPPWDYSVEISDLPAGYTHTYDLDDGTTSPDGDSGTINLTTADVDNADFGLDPVPGSISGTVFNDRDNDGLLDAPDGDTGIAGVTISLVGTDLAGNPVSATTVTAADGTYSFPNVDAGTYTITEGATPTFNDGIDTPGTHAVAAGNDAHTVTLAVGQSSINNDFAEIATSSLSGTVFEDDNNDGDPAGENGIAGILVTLTGTDDAGNAINVSTTTAPDGSYHFAALRPGTYTVTEGATPTYFDGMDDAGSLGGDDTTTNDEISGVILPLGTDATDYDFGEIAAASIAGSVLDDLGNPIAGVTIDLVGTDMYGNPVTATVVTDPNGDYLFPALPPGTYTVTETQPAGYGDSDDHVGSVGGDDSVNDVFSAITLAPGVDATDYDFTEAPSSVSGHVIDDLGNPIAGVTIDLIGTDINGNPVVTSTVTNTDGEYEFTGLVAGTYEVTETQPVGYGDGNESVGSTGGDDTVNDVISSIAVDPGEASVNNDFAEVTASISGTVFNDRNSNGVQDPGEPGIAGVTVDLDGLDVHGNPVNVTVATDASGDYVFDGLLAGDYDVTETQPSEYFDGADTAGSEGGDASTNDIVSDIPLAAGVDATDYDFGELGNVVTGTVWIDSDGDGTIDPDEAIRLDGVELQLIDNDGNVVATTTTNPDGTYAFASVPAGMYLVVQTQPDAYGTTTPNTLEIIVPIGGLSDVDFGEQPGTISGLVWNDDDTPNGVLDIGEDLLSGVSVHLLDADGNVIATTVTGGGGEYEFTDLPAGDYQVQIEIPTGDALTNPNSGEDDTIDSDFGYITNTVATPLAPGADVTDIDAGLVEEELDLTVEIVVDDDNVNVGDQVTFTTTGSNSGNGPISGDSVIVVDIPDNIDILDVVADDDWEIVVEGQTVTLTWTGDLLPGESLPDFDIVGTVEADGDLTTEATISTGDGSVETTLSNNADDVRIRVSSAPPGPLAFTGASVFVGLLLAAAMVSAGGSFSLAGALRRRRTNG